MDIFRLFGEPQAFRDLRLKVEALVTTQTQLAQQLVALKDQSTSAKAKILAKIAELTQAIADAQVVSPEVEAALAALTAEVQAIDAIVP